MNKLIYLLLSCVVCLSVYGQSSSVSLQISHRFGAAPLELDEAIYVAGTGTVFSLARLEYYISHPYFVLDDGNTVALPVEYMLVSERKGFLNFDLMDIDPSKIRALGFYMGVDSVPNHSDPARHDSGHPLAPQNPSMHWGWAAGYIFMAIEGQTADDQGNITGGYTVHSIGDNLYTPVELPVWPVETEDGHRIDLYADFRELIGDLELRGLVAMGGGPQNQRLMDHIAAGSVFYDPNLSAGLNRDFYGRSVEVFPNPVSDDHFFVKLPHPIDKPLYLTIYDSAGRICQTAGMDAPQVSELPVQLRTDLAPGIYFVIVSSATGLHYQGKFCIY